MARRAAGRWLALVAMALAACADPADRTDPTALYSRYCARCHGEDGRGEKRSVGLNPRLDLTASELARSGQRQLVYQRIAFGYGPMPAFSHKLEPADIERLTQYSLDLAEDR